MSQRTLPIPLEVPAHRMSHRSGDNGVGVCTVRPTPVILLPRRMIGILVQEAVRNVVVCCPLTMRRSREKNASAMFACEPMVSLYISE